MFVSKKKEHWKIITSKKAFYKNTIVGAEGVKSKVRYKTAGPFPKEDLAITFERTAKGTEKEKPIIKFLTGITGYIWSFRRHDHSSVGIGSELDQRKKLKKLLDEFIHSYYRKIRIVTRFIAMLPSARSPEFFKKPCATKDWILVGDAASHANPITRDGIFYALWSGKLAAKAIEKNNPESYETQWGNHYGNYLEKRRENRDYFYNPFA